MLPYPAATTRIDIYLWSARYSDILQMQVSLYLWSENGICLFYSWYGYNFIQASMAQIELKHLKVKYK